MMINGTIPPRGEEIKVTPKTKKTIQQKKDKASTEYGRIIKHMLDVIEICKKLDNNALLDNAYNMYDYVKYQYDMNKRI